MDTLREFKKDGYVYILKTNKKQYKCVKCSSTFTIDLYNTRSGHSGKCRNSKSAKKTVKKTAEIMHKIQKLPSKNEKKLFPGDPIRVPTKHFTKEITPPRSIYDSDGNFEESSDEQSNQEMKIEFDPILEPNPNPMTNSKLEIKNIMKRIEERQKMKRRKLEEERKKEKLKRHKDLK
jgi:hypothetical protein